MTSVIAESVKNDLISMVFGQENDNPEASLQMLVNSKMRKGLADDRIVYRDGITRYPEVNHFTGATAVYNNLEILKLAVSPEVLEPVKTAYGNAEVGLYHGPPSLIVKPGGSGISPPFAYWFQDLSPGTKYTAVVPLTEHDSEDNSGNLEILRGSEHYFDLLNLYYNFVQYCKPKDILYLESKWFSIDEANKFLSQYTMLYNYYVRGINPDRETSISTKVRDFYMKHKVEVPQKFVKLEWVLAPLQIGKATVFSSKQILRTRSSQDENTRIYVQIPLEPKPRNWETFSERITLKKSYETGRFGNWIKPGLRLYLRKNSTESNWRDLHETVEEKEARTEFIRTHSEVLGL